MTNHIHFAHVDFGKHCRHWQTIADIGKQLSILAYHYWYLQTHVSICKHCRYWQTFVNTIAHPCWYWQSVVDIGPPLSIFVNLCQHWQHCFTFRRTTFPECTINDLPQLRVHHCRVVISWAHLTRAHGVVDRPAKIAAINRQILIGKLIVCCRHVCWHFQVDEFCSSLKIYKFKHNTIYIIFKCLTEWNRRRTSLKLSSFRED